MDVWCNRSAWWDVRRRTLLAAVLSALAAPCWAQESVTVRSVNPRAPVLTRVSLTGHCIPARVAAELTVQADGQVTLLSLQRGGVSVAPAEIALLNDKLRGEVHFVGARLLCTDDVWEVVLTFPRRVWRLGFIGVTSSGGHSYTR